jgi:acrylyl-CoA reductase (NADPH)
MFKALVLEEKDGKVVSSIQQVDEARLPEGDVTVAVSHSNLNYKDGLILLGQGRLVRQYRIFPASISPAPCSKVRTRTSSRAMPSS